VGDHSRARPRPDGAAAKLAHCGCKSAQKTVRETCDSDTCDDCDTRGDNTGPTVAPVATVAVAKPQNVTVEPIPPAATLAELEAAANRFCDAVGDDDEPRAVMLKDCREFPAERRSWLIDYLIDQAEMHKPVTGQADITEELRRCTECRNLARSGVCLAASRGEPMVGRTGFPPLSSRASRPIAAMRMLLTRSR
jgi:hypothetical protein